MTQIPAYVATPLQLRQINVSPQLFSFPSRQTALPAHSPAMLKLAVGQVESLEGFTLVLVPPCSTAEAENEQNSHVGPSPGTEEKIPPSPDSEQGQPDFLKPVEASLPSPAYPPPSIERRGVLWVFQYKGQFATIKNTSGIPYLLQLLQNPGRDFPVVALVAVCRGQGEGPKPGTAGERLDAQSIGVFKKRLTSLEENRDRAREFQDFARLEAIEEEMESLKREIVCAVGLGGRRREMVSDTERLRKTVSKAISRVVSPLHVSHPGLGRHLSRSIRLGRFMSYTPGRPVRWRCRA